MEEYDYKCPKCGAGKGIIEFVGLKMGGTTTKLKFYCPVCDKLFSKKDHEESYFHHKTKSLIKRYPQHSQKKVKKRVVS